MSKKMIKINYESDFKLTEKTEEQRFANVPFKFVYSTSSVIYTALYDGHKYVNCKPNSDHSVTVIFNNHGLGVGKLKVRREFFIPDGDFPDGVYNVVSNDPTDVMLVEGKTEGFDVEETFRPPYVVSEGSLVPIEVVDSLDSDASDKALSANQGRILNEHINVVTTDVEEINESIKDINETLEYANATIKENTNNITANAEEITKTKANLDALEGIVAEKADASKVNHIETEVQKNTDAISNNTARLVVLEGDGEGSIKETVAKGIAEVVANAPEDLNTLKEVADYIASDKTKANEIEKAISDLEVKDTQLEDSIKANAEAILSKQPLLTGDEFKTINGQNVMGEGNIEIEGSGVSVEVVDNLDSDATDKALSARQGKVLKGMIPTKVSELENDEGYITEIPDEYATKEGVSTAIANNKEVFVATYGKTTYDEILEAYNVGKAVIVNHNNLQYHLSLVTTYAVQFFSHDDMRVYIIQCQSTNIWTSTTYRNDGSVTNHNDKTATIEIAGKSATVPTKEYVDNLIINTLNTEV